MKRKLYKKWRGIFRFLLILALILLPAFIAKVNVLCAAEESLVLKVTDITPYSNNSSVAIVKTVVRNEGKVTFDQLKGELYIYRGDALLYSCSLIYREKVHAGEEKTPEMTVSNLREAAPLLSYPVNEMSYSWIPVSARFIGFAYIFTQDYGPKAAVPWLIIVWLALASGAFAAGLRAAKARKEAENSPAEETEEERVSEAKGYGSGSSYSYGSGVSYGGGSSDTSSGSGTGSISRDSTAPSEAAAGNRDKVSGVNRDALISAQKRLERASTQEAAYRSQGLTQDAETQEHFKRAAFSRVLQESAGLSGKDKERFNSARERYENASRREAGYRAGNSRENAEFSQYLRESAYGDMLKAIAEKEGRRSSAFESAEHSYKAASSRASRYRASGSVENAAEAEHEMRQAYGNMLKYTSDLDRRAYDEYSSQQRSYESESRTAASYRRQGLWKDAEMTEHRMRLSEARMLRVKAEAKGNLREFEDARKSFENASRAYASYKCQGLERDANREKDYMDRAHAKMMWYV